MSTLATLSSYDYAAGSWALRLTGQVSPLSTLADRVVLKRSRFHLRLWDRGDAPDGVQTDGEGQTEGQIAALAGVPRQPPPAFEVSGHGPDLADLSNLVQTYVQHYLQGQGLTPSQGLSQGPHRLTPVGLTRHRLTVEIGPSPAAAVMLSFVQLADLATVLGQAEQAVDHLFVEHLPEDVAPAQGWPSRLRRPRRLPLWTGSVAAVLVAAVLGSQWLGQSPPDLMLSPTPTTETTAMDEATGSPTGESGATPGRSLPLDAAALEADAPGADSTGSDPQETQGLQGLQDLPEPQARRSSPAPGASPAPRTSDSDPRERPSPSPRTPRTSTTPNAAGPGGPATEPDRATPAPQPRPDNRAAMPSQADSPSSPGVESFSTESRPPADSAPMPPSEGVGSRSRMPTASSSPTAPSPMAPDAPDSDATDSAPIPEVTTELAPAPSVGLADSAPGDGYLESLRLALVATWSPIPGLTSPLRYRLTLGPTGEILAIEPLTAPSRPYLTQTTSLSVGTVLPNLRLPEATTVEVELLPSGDVNVQRLQSEG